MLNIATLPNGLRIANVTPHAITFWQEDWSEPFEVPPSGRVINASPIETSSVYSYTLDGKESSAIKFVETAFATQESAEEILVWCEKNYALPVGSIIAAQAYPGRVVAMTPAPGYERVAVPLPKPIQEAINILEADYRRLVINYSEAIDIADEEVEAYQAIRTLQAAMATPTKRMSPSKFTVFSAPIEDGVYAVKSGNHVKIDTFTWGYEGEASVNDARVIRQDGTNCLAYGPGVDFVSDGVVWSTK